jgi:hypothetical protein
MGRGTQTQLQLTGAIGANGNTTMRKLLLAIALGLVARGSGSGSVELYPAIRQRVFGEHPRTSADFYQSIRQRVFNPGTRTSPRLPYAVWQRVFVPASPLVSEIPDRAELSDYATLRRITDLAGCSGWQLQLAQSAIRATSARLKPDTPQSTTGVASSKVLWNVVTMTKGKTPQGEMENEQTIR